MRLHRMYLDRPPEMGPVMGFTMEKRMEWIQSPEWFLLAICRHEGVFQSSGTSYPFGDGTAIVIPPNTRCRLDRTKEDDLGTHWWFSFRPQESGLLKVAIRSVTSLVGSIEHWDPILRRGFDLAPYTKSMLYSSAWNILWVIADNAVEARSHVGLAAVERYIAENFASPLPISELAEIGQVSHNHLIRLFHEEHGMTPTEYIRAERLNRACHLLLSTELPIKQIGAMVGYANPQHFHNIIKMTCGCSPQDIRVHRAIPSVHQGQARKSQAVKPTTSETVGNAK